MRCTRCGDSKMTTARSSSAATAASRSARWRPERGTKPSKLKRSVDKPDTTSAASAAEGPGTVSTWIPSARAARTNREPGSLTNGVPASVTKAMAAPDLARAHGGRSGGRFVVAVVRHQSGASYAGMVQQFERPAGVLAVDVVRRCQGIDGARRQVAQVAYGRGDYDDPAAGPDSGGAGPGWFRR